MFANIQFGEFAGGSFYEVLGKIFRSFVPGEWMEAVGRYEILFLVLGLAIGLSQCMAGYKLRKIWTGIDGMVVCGMGGAAAAVHFGLGTGTVIAVTACASVAGGLLGYFLWGAGIFLRVFSVISVCIFAVGILYKLEALGLIIALAAGLIAAILAVAFVKVMLILYTSVAGGLAAGACLSALFGAEVWYLPLAAGGIFAVAGIIIQAVTNRATSAEQEESGDEPVLSVGDTLNPDIPAAALASGMFGTGSTGGLTAAGNETVITADMAAGIAGAMAAGTAWVPGTGNAGTLAAGTAGIPGTENTGTLAAGTAGIPGTGNIGTTAAGTAGIPGAGNAGTLAAGITGTPGTGNAGAMAGADGATVIRDAGATANMAGMGIPEAAVAMESGAAENFQVNGTPEIVRICKNCGAEFPANTKFCMKCGQRLG